MSGDLDDLIKDLNSIVQNFDEAAQKTRRKIVSDASDKVTDKTPVDTGDLRDAWDIEFGYKGDADLLFNDMEYAPHVEYGHRVRGTGGTRSAGKRRKGKKRTKTSTSSASGGFIKGVYMLRDTSKEIERNMDEYGKYLIEQLGLKND